MTSVGEHITEAIRHNRAGRAILQLIDTFDQHSAVVAASAIAFDAFLSLVPLAAFAGMVMHRLHESDDLIMGPIFRAAPTPVAEIVAGAIGRLSDDDAAVIAPLSVVAFMWTTSAGISTAISIFEKMFHSPPRVWWWRRGISIMCVIAGLATIAVVTAVTVGIGMLSRPAGALAGLIVPSATLTGLLVAFFRIAVRPVTDPVPLVGSINAAQALRGAALATPLPVSFRGRRRVAPGVFVTIVLWAIVSGLFSVYVATLARYATLYGQLAAVAIFLLWLWLLALALLVGGEVNAQLDGVRGA